MFRVYLGFRGLGVSDDGLGFGVLHTYDVHIGSPSAS